MYIVGTYKPWCVPFQIIPNQFKFHEVHSSWGLDTSHELIK